MFFIIFNRYIQVLGIHTIYSHQYPTLSEAPARKSHNHMDVSISPGPGLDWQIVKILLTFPTCKNAYFTLSKGAFRLTNRTNVSEINWNALLCLIWSRPLSTTLLPLFTTKWLWSCVMRDAWCGCGCGGAGLLRSDNWTEDRHHTITIWYYYYYYNYRRFDGPFSRSERSCHVKNSMCAKPPRFRLPLPPFFFFFLKL